MNERQSILSARELSKHFGGVAALERVSFDLFPGEVLALAGDNGAGKSTLIKAIAGVHQPDHGEIWYDGARVQFASPREARDRGIETIYQDLALADNLDVGANVFLGREPAARFLGILPRIDRPAMREAARRTMASLDIEIERLGVPEQRKVMALIQRLKTQDVAVIFISHNLGDIFAVADRILVLRRGVKAGERRIGETDGDEIVKRMVGG